MSMILLLLLLDDFEINYTTLYILCVVLYKIMYCTECQRRYRQTTVGGTSSSSSSSSDTIRWDRSQIGYATDAQLSDVQQRAMAEYHQRWAHRRPCTVNVPLHDTDSDRFRRDTSMNAPEHARVHVFQIDPNEFCNIQRMLFDSARLEEVGGTLIASSDGNLTIDEQQRGGSDHVKIPISTFMFHTHPNSCDKRQTCGLGMPSFQDIRRVHIDCVLYGCVAHFIFAKDGTYVVSINPAVKKRMLAAFQSSKKEFHTLLKEYIAPFSEMQEAFENQKHHAAKYPNFRKQWLTRANQSSSIRCCYFSQKELPCIAVWQT